MEGWLYLLRPVRAAMATEPTAAEGELLQEHFAYLERLRDEGRLIVAGPSIVGADALGLAVLDIAAEPEARAVMEGDPAVAGGLMTAELRPLRLSVVRS